VGYHARKVKRGSCKRASSHTPRRVLRRLVVGSFDAELPFAGLDPAAIGLAIFVAVTP
jgi:hypothetical protein